MMELIAEAELSRTTRTEATDSVCAAWTVRTDATVDAQRYGLLDRFLPDNAQNVHYTLDSVDFEGQYYWYVTYDQTF